MNQHASAARDAVDPSTWTSLGLWRWPCGKLALLRSLQTGSNAATMHLTRCTDDREACRLAAERLRHASEQVEVTPLEWDLRPGVHAPALLHAEQDAAPTPPAPLGDEDAADDAERIFAGLPVSTVHAYLDRILALRVHLWKRMAPALATHVALELAGLLAGVQEAETEEDQVRAIARLWAFPTLVLCPGAQQPSREPARAAGVVPELTGGQPTDLPWQTVSSKVVKHVRADTSVRRHGWQVLPVSTTPRTRCSRLRELHPPATDAAALAAPGAGAQARDAQPPLAERAVVKNAVMGIPYTSAAGPSRWSPSLLHQALSLPAAGAEVLTAMCGLFDRVVHRGLEPQAGALWAHARLIPLRKPDGGVRPIAIGEIFRRVLGRLAVTSLAHDAVETLAPDQYGVGRKAGLEAMVMRTRLAVLDNPGWGVLKVDISNAFNTVRRPAFMRLVQAQFPHLWPLVRTCYACPAPLRAGKHVLKSESGVQQGDPLAPLLFSLALHRQTRDITHAPGQALVQCWYLDDGAIAGPVRSLVAFLEALDHSAREIDLSINRRKSELVLPPGSCETDITALSSLHGLPVVPWSRVTLLGTVLDTGGDIGCVDRTLAATLELADKVAGIHEPEEAYHLLRASVGPARVVHLARTLPPEAVLDRFAAFDDAWRHIVARTLGVTAADGQNADGSWRAEWRLPLRCGGLGLTSLRDMSLPGFVAGSRAAARTLDEGEVLRAQREAVPPMAPLSRQPPEPPPPPRARPSHLARWRQFHDLEEAWLQQVPGVPDAEVEDLLDSQARGLSRFYSLLKKDWVSAPGSTPSERFRRQSLSSPHAAAWLGMPSGTVLGGIPWSPALGRDTWFTAVRHFLGLPVAGVASSAGLRCPAIVRGTTATCDALLDALGHHAQNCALGPTRYGRHAAVIDVLVRFATSAGHTVRREVRLEDVPGITSARPGDFSFDNNVVDVAVVAPDGVAAARSRKRGSFAAARAASPVGSSGHAANMVAFIVTTYSNVDVPARALLSGLARDFARVRQVPPRLGADRPLAGRQLYYGMAEPQGPPYLKNASRTGDAAGVSFQAVILDTYGRREQCGAAFLETLVAAYMRHRGVSQMLASTALHRSLSLAVYRSVAAAVLLRHPGPTLSVASQHWLETGRRLFVGEVLSESEAESH
ncbi:Retrotransposable element [Porphyridium purpureum]|uniref:Retrotransposable element n=1 Tax=Porphyridium purpureum TaxID=35688 RepID=A0A5J4YHS8_PORPP|nr:Retrotransposable element [Porphyridium purpureum]|eukprot:POR7233..scf252_46